MNASSQPRVRRAARTSPSCVWRRGAQAQLAVYWRCVQEQRANFNWLAFFDLDEFLLLREPCASLGSLAPHQPPFSGPSVLILRS